MLRGRHLVSAYQINLCGASSFCARVAHRSRGIKQSLHGARRGIMAYIMAWLALAASNRVRGVSGARRHRWQNIIVARSYQRRACISARRINVLALFSGANINFIIAASCLTNGISVIISKTLIGA